MKIIPLLVFISCGHPSAELNISELKKASVVIDSIRNNTITSQCDVDYDSTLTRLAKSFSATNVDLGHSISGELNQFVIKIDTNCLRKQMKYQFFITVILAKLALYQVKCCNQHYELRATNDDSPPGANVIVGEFMRMAGYDNKPIDMVSSEEVELYIKKSAALESDPYLKSIMKNIEKEEERMTHL